jgi:hypothetical protein
MCTSSCWGSGKSSSLSFACWMLHFIKVERVFTLWANDIITVESIREAEVATLRKVKKPTTAIGKAVNKSSGKDSIKAHAFGDTNWGSKARSLLISINNLKAGVFKEIVNEAQEFAKVGRNTYGDAVDSSPEGDEDDARANIVDFSDSDSDPGDKGKMVLDDSDDESDNGSGGDDECKSFVVLFMSFSCGKISEFCGCV